MGRCPFLPWRRQNTCRYLWYQSYPLGYQKTVVYDEFVTGGIRTPGIKTPKLLHGQQNSFIMLWTNGIIGPIASLMIYDRQWKTGRSTGSCTNQDFLTWYISFVCISSRTYLHFMYMNVCRHVSICVGMHAFASAHRYKYTWVCMITHVFKCMLQHVIILPLIAIDVILFCFYLHLCNFM